MKTQTENPWFEEQLGDALYLLGAKDGPAQRLVLRAFAKMVLQQFSDRYASARMDERMSKCKEELGL